MLGSETTRLPGQAVDRRVEGQTVSQVKTFSGLSHMVSSLLFLLKGGGRRAS